QHPTLQGLLLYAACFALGLLYYAVPEGLWGATLGKAYFGLRVVDRDGHRPGVPKALLRALVYRSVVVLAVEWFDWIGRLAPFLLFATARRSNRIAALQDLISRTRVVAKASLQTRPALERERVAGPPSSQ